MGCMLPTVFGLFLGEPGESETMMKFILGFPLILVMIHYLLFICVFHHPTPVWLVSQGRVEEATKVMEHIYDEKLAIREKIDEY